MNETYDYVLAQPVQSTGFVEGEPEPQPQAGSVLAALRHQWLTMLIVSVVVGSGLCAGVWLGVRPKYEVTATMHIASFVQPILFSNMDTDGSRQFGQYIETQARIIASPAVVAGALDAPEVRALPSFARTEDAVELIQERLEVAPVRRTELLEVKMTGEHPEEMAVFVNSLLRTYIRHRDETKRKSDEKILRSLRTEQTELEARLEAKSIELRQMAMESGLGTGEGASSAIDAYDSEIRQLVTETSRDRAIVAAKLDALESGDHADFPGVDPAELEAYLQADSGLAHIRSQIRSLELESVDNERLGRGPAYPGSSGTSEQVAKLREQVSVREAWLREQYQTVLTLSLEEERRNADITLRVLNEELDHVTRRRAQVAGQIFVLDDARHERERLEGALAQVRQKIWSVEVEQNRMARVTIESPAHAPKAPNIDKRLEYTAAVFLMSLCLGAGAAVARQRFDSTIREPAEVAVRLGLPLLGSVQHVPDTSGIAWLGDERMLDRLRRISTALLASSRTRSIRSRLITSPTAKSGKSSLAMSLAQSLASTGRRVLLIDGDNSNQGVTCALEMTGRPGLKELIADKCQPEQAIHSCHVAGLQIMPAGRRDEAFGRALVGLRAQMSVRSLFDNYDEVIVDSPPVMASSDAIVLATLVDEVIMVVRAGKSTQQEVLAARQCLGSVGSKLVGVILNAVDSKSVQYPYCDYAYAANDDVGATDN